MNKRLLLLIAILHCQLSIFNCPLSAQVPYGYAPAGDVATEDLAALGGGKNEFVQGLVCFDPSADPILERLKGKSILGVRCYLRADYKQARQKRSAVLASTGTPANIQRTTYADFTQGWNDVLFDAPLPIGDEPIYLGLQAYETIGTPYPLVTYAPATVPQSCIVNLAKSKWEEFTDRGTLLVSALLEEDAAAEFACAAYAQNTTHPQTVAPDADFTGGLYIHNFTAEPIHSLEIAMQGEGAAAATLRTLELEQPVPPQGSTVITAQLRAGSAEGTAVGWTATVTRINQAATQPARPGTTPLYVTLDNFLRTPLVEEFTSQRCVACPQMAYFLEKAFEQYTGDYVYVSHHTGFAEDVFTTQPDREIVYIFGGYENEYNPAIMYNRSVLEGESTVIQGIRAMAPDPYIEALTAAAAMPAMAEVQLQLGADGAVTVSGRVARDLMQTPLRLSCYLVEDGISAVRYPQKGLDGDPDAPADLKDVFRHNGIILHYFTADAAGDLLSVNASGQYSVTYPAAQPEGFGGTRRRLVAFVHRLNKDNLRDNAVLNATQLLLGTDGVQEHAQMCQAPFTATMFDLSGRRVNNAPSRRGIYIINRQKIIK